MQEMITIAEAAEAKGMKLTTVRARIRRAGLKSAHGRGRGKQGRYDRQAVMELLKVPLRNSHEAPEGWTTVKRYCETTAHAETQVRYRAKLAKLETLVGYQVKTYRIQDLDDVMAGDYDMAEGVDKEACLRCGEYDTMNQVRDGLCLDCWCHDYCKRKKI